LIFDLHLVGGPVTFNVRALTTMATMIAAMKKRLRSGLTDQDRLSPSALASPISEARLALDEAELGFALPDDLRQLYLKIANGGFGPGYGLIGLSGGKPDDTGKTANQIYLLFRGNDSDDPAWLWPVGLLPICYWGCAIYSCIDCSDRAFRVRIFDPNAHVSCDTWDDAFFEECDSFSDWISAWCGGVDLWDRMYGDNGRIKQRRAAQSN
jgi:hypothetical protein